jgi:hypothetical protein
MRIRDHLQWQDDTNLDAFITRLTDGEERVRQNVRQYVVGDKVRDRLDSMLATVGERLGDNRDVGRYIHGAFGSGKSNLMTVLGKMLERDEMVYDHGHAALRELRAKHPWLDKHQTLVVRINMMGKTSLVRALFDGYNEALPAGIPKLVFTDEERVFDLIEKDAQRIGGLDALLGQAATDAAFETIPEMPRGIPGPLFIDLYHRLRRGNRDQRLALASALQNWRNHGASSIRPDDLWVDARAGLDRIARHANDHGYTAIAWLIDELVIWIRGRSRADYVNEVNNLSALVDHDAARVLPFFVVVAVQMDISRTCPEDLSEQDFHVQMGFVRDRFQPQLELEDQDLYEVAAQRVLARKRDLTPEARAAFEGAIDRAFQKHRESIAALGGGLPMDFVRRLYPFNPALLRILVDVTQALSRNRTAIAALYRLLNQHANLEVGQFIPVGALWSFVFEPENVSYVKQNTSSKLCQRLADTYETYVRLEPKLEVVAKGDAATLAQLQQVVRTVLLCQLSDRPYFPDDGRALGERLTASTLLHLNETDIRALSPRTGISKIAGWFRALNGVAPHVTVSGETDPTISIKVEQLDIERVLNMARAQVRHNHRFAFMRRLLVEELGLELGTTNDGPLEVTWKGTKRRGRVKLANARTLSYAGQTNEFDPGKDEFLIIVDYPFDEEPGRSREDDRDNCQRARGRSTYWTLTWLPEHLSSDELEALTNAAAVDIIRQDPRVAFEDLSPKEAESANRLLEAYQLDRKRQLSDAVRRVFFDKGEIHGMKASLDNLDASGLERSSALERLAKTLLDKRYPNHPPFTRRVTQAELGMIADWVVRAAKTGATIDLKGSEMPLVDAFLLPLEIAHRGPSGIMRRTDGRYLSAIEAWVGSKRHFEAQDLRAAMAADIEGSEKWGFGLSKDVSNFFLYYLLQVAGFEAQTGERSETVQGPGDIKERFRLVKEEVVDAPTWDKALGVADRLLDHRGQADLPTPPEQAKLIRDTARKASDLRTQVRDVEARLREVCVWAGVAPNDSARLRTVAELSAWLDELLADTGNASRTRRMAALHGDVRLDGFVRVRTTLPGEARAITEIAGQRNAFEHLDRHGSDDDRTVVVTRLRNLLTDSVNVALLGERAGAWVDDAKARFAAHAAGAAQRADAERQRVEEAERWAREERQAREEAERRLAEQRQREETERTRGRTVTASRQAVGRRVQEELAQMLEAEPSLRQVRVRIVLEPAEPGES